VVHVNDLALTGCRALAARPIDHSRTISFHEGGRDRQPAAAINIKNRGSTTAPSRA
jgi:hypothetical protein